MGIGKRLVVRVNGGLGTAGSGRWGVGVTMVFVHQIRKCYQRVVRREFGNGMLRAECREAGYNRVGCSRTGPWWAGAVGVGAGGGGGGNGCVISGKGAVYPRHANH